MADTTSTGTNSSDPLYDAEHPDHAAAVARHLDRFREPGDSRTAAAPAATERDPIPAYSKEHPYWNAEHPQHAAAVAEIQAQLRAQAPPEEAAARTERAFAMLDEHDLRDLRQQSGVVQPTLAAPLQERWDDQAFGTFMQIAVEERLEPRVSNAIMAFYIEAALSRDWDVAVQQFRSQYVGQGKLTADQAEALLEFASGIHGKPYTRPATKARGVRHMGNPNLR